MHYSKLPRCVVFYHGPKANWLDACLCGETLCILLTSHGTCLCMHVYTCKVALYGPGPWGRLLQVHDGLSIYSSYADGMHVVYPCAAPVDKSTVLKVHDPD